MRACALSLVVACSAPSHSPGSPGTAPASTVPPGTPEDAGTARAQLLDASAATPAPLLRPIGRASQHVNFVQGRDRLALSIGEAAWVTAGDNGLVIDADTGRALKRFEQRFTGGSTRFWGRTPAIGNGEPRKPRLARAGTAKEIPAPGVVEDVIRLGPGDDEVWQYTAKMASRLAIVDGRDRITELPALASIGKPVPGIQPGLCASPSAWRIAPAPDGVAALVMECHIATPLRMQTIAADRRTTVRTLESMQRADLEPSRFAVTAEGTPIIAGRRAGTLAIARGKEDGTWIVTTTTIPAVDVTGLAISEGAIWTVTIGAGADGQDAWTLAKDGAAVELRDQSGNVLSARDLGYDAQLGVVVGAIDVAARDRDLFGPLTTWLFAEHPPATAIELP